MKTFHDKNSHEWQLDINLGKIWEIEQYQFPDDTTIKVLDAPDLLTKLTETRVVFAMVWVCCRSAAQAAGFKNELEFASLFNAEAISAARLALYEELRPFLPTMAASLRALTERYSTGAAMIDRKMSQVIETEFSNENLEAEIDRMIAKTLQTSRETRQ